MPKTTKEVYDDLLQRFEDDSARTGIALVNKLQKAATELAEAKRQIETLKSSGLPADHVAVPKADADLLDEYRSLGDVKTLRAAVERVPQLESDIRKRDHESRLSEVAGTAKYELAVLKKLVPEGVEFLPTTVKDEKTGKDIPTFKVKDKDPDGKERVRTLDQWENDPDVKPLLPALKPGDTQRAMPSDRPVSASSGYEPDRSRRSRPVRQKEEPDIAELVQVGNYGSM